MATAHHLHPPRAEAASPAPAGVRPTLTALEATLSGLASESALAAESLRERRDGLGAWWLDRLVHAVLAARDTCRSARAAIDERHPSPHGDASAGSPRSAARAASSRAILPERRPAGRWIVVGYDGSQAAERALLRAADAAGDRDAVVVVTTAAQVYSAGAAAEPLLEPAADPSRLLATAKATITARASFADVVLVEREGDPAEELLEVARAANADLVIVGRRGRDFVARTLLGSVATRVVEQAPCDVLVVA